MKLRRRSGVVLCALVLLTAFALAGCDFFATLFDPLIGTWTGTWAPLSGSPFTVTLELKADNTFSETMAFSPTPVTLAGSYVNDKKAKMLTTIVTSTSDPGMVPVGTSGVATYALSANNKTLTVTSIQGVVVFSKK